MGKRFAHDGFYGGYWEFPGGKIEEGESEQDALRREFQEELGAEVDEAEFLCQRIWTYPTREVELNFFMIKMNTLKLDELQKNSHSELAWLTKEEALSRQILPANVDLIRDL